MQSSTDGPDQEQIAIERLNDSALRRELLEAVSRVASAVEVCDAPRYSTEAADRVLQVWDSLEADSPERLDALLTGGDEPSWDDLEEALEALRHSREPTL